MNKRVWVFQHTKEIKRKGANSASWYVGWYDLGGKRHSESCGRGSRGRNLAEKRQRRIQSELDTGIHQSASKKLWKDFRSEYERLVLSNLETSSQIAIKVALDSFERHVKPARLESIHNQTMAAFVAARRHDKGKKAGSSVSPATINKDLRHLKAALRRASEWGYLPSVPKIRMVREPDKIPRFVTPKHFEMLYSIGCDSAALPRESHESFTPAQWWRALVVIAYMTGLRIKEILAVRWADLDLERQLLVTRARDNKAKRDEYLPLHAVVIEHVQPLRSSASHVFVWPHDPRELWTEFGKIQLAAGIHLDCPERHVHTKACHVYGFHDLRRAFATMNAPRLRPEVLQKLMRHRSYTTTLGYVNMSSQVGEAVSKLVVPPILGQDRRE